ncbi:hypothetical protein [Clostridium cochlearium]|uniref:hypothetical protein n=1 Tax=Clostridium cochlearium TaxID=1494 RepID=UPI00241EE15D|nr:hypothetical protein [Clostridium cochlearium]MBE6064905.1 hypothetical protein [Clostridium cochlearium]
MTNNHIEDKEHTHKNEPHIHGGKYIGEKKDGSKYVGQWKDDKIHGEGIYICEDGEKYIGTWEDDEAVSYKKI